MWLPTLKSNGNIRSATGRPSGTCRSRDVRCVVGCPVNVEGRVWGAMMMHAMENEPEPGVTEDRMREFVELISTAIANAQARSELGVLVQEQAALRRVATLVARGVSLRQARVIVLTVERFTVGHVLEEQSPRPDAAARARQRGRRSASRSGRGEPCRAPS